MRMPARLARVTALVALSALLASAAACSSDDGAQDETGPITLTFTWWGNDDRAGRYTQAVELFQKANPQIKVNTSFAEFSSYWTARSTEAAGRALPDVMQMDLAYLREYSANGHLLDLSDRIGKDIDTSGFDQEQLKAGSFEGKQVALPAGTNTLGLFVNPAIVKKAGLEVLPADYTWAQYNDWISQLTKAGVKNDAGRVVYGGGDYRGALWLFIQWLVQKGVTPYTDDGKLNFTKDHIKEFLNQAQGLDSAKVFFPATRAAQVKPLDGFAAKEQATIFTWDNILAAYVKDTGLADLELLPMPNGADGKKNMFWKPSMLLSVAANSKHQAAAAKLAGFLVTDPQVGKIFGNSRGVPANKAQRDAVTAASGSPDAKVTAFEQQVKDQVTAPTPIPVRGYGTLEQVWIRLSEDLAYGKITVDKFAEQWWAEAEQATQ